MKRFTERLIVSFLYHCGLLILVFFITGCSLKKELSLMIGGTPNEITYWEKVVTQFKEKSGIAVKLIRQTTDTDQRKQSIIFSLRGRQADPDVMLVDVAWIGQLAASGWLLPLDSSKLSMNSFFRSVIDLADRYKGSLIGLPLYIDAGLLYYRKDLLNQYGFKAPPETWNELLEMSKKVQSGEREKNRNFWGYVWQGAQYEGLVCNALELFTSAGGGIIRNGVPVITDDNNHKALDYMVSLIHENRISPPNTYTDMKEEEVRISFQSGNALFERNWPYAWGLHNSDGSPVKGKTGIAPLPFFEGNKSAATLGGWHVVVSAYTDQPEQAMQLISYLTSYEVQRDMVLNLGWNPGRRDLYTDETIMNAMPHLVELKTVFENAVPRPVVPYYSEISQVMQKQINAALAGQVSPGDALKSANSAVGIIISKYEKE
jgi:multiple sugar transport system substrate-binding protein